MMTRNESIQHMRSDGATFSQIGKEFKISVGRARQICLQRRRIQTFPELPRIISNSLVCAGVNNIYSLLLVPLEDLKKIPSIGKKGLESIKIMIENYNARCESENNFVVQTDDDGSYFITQWVNHQTIYVCGNIEEKHSAIALSNILNEHQKKE